MFSAIGSIFWNSTENRMRAGLRLPLHLIVMILCMTGTVMIAQQISPHANPHGLTLGSIPYSIATTVGIVLSVIIAGAIYDKRHFANFGVHLNKTWFKDLAFGLALGAFLMVGIFATEYACGWITVKSVFSGSATELFYKLIPAVVLFIGVGIHEEFMSRAYHLKNLAEGFNFKILGARGAIVLSVLVSSAVFGLMHAGNPNASTISTFNIFLAGLFLAVGYIYTGELGISIGLHITWNFFQGPVFGFPVSGGNFQTLVAIEQGGSDVITGGAFGPEAGLIGLAAMLVGTVLILGYVKMRNGTVRINEQVAEPELR